MVVVALVAAEVEAVAVAVAGAEVVAVAEAVVTEMETEKETFQVDISGNNWKTDLLLQPQGGKSHMCGHSRR